MKKPTIKFLGFGGNELLVRIALLGIIVALALPALAKVRESKRRDGCNKNLMQLGLSLGVWASHHEGDLPPLSNTPGRLMFDADGAIFPEYLPDSAMLLCPRDTGMSQEMQGADPKEQLDDHAYYYLGYIIQTEAEALAYVDAYQVAVVAGMDIESPIYIGDKSLPRLRAKHEFAEYIPIMIEKPGHHDPKDGGHVLFLDGHVEFIKMDKRFPMTTAFIEALESIDQ